MHKLKCIAMSVCDSLLLGYQDSLFTQWIYNIDSAYQKEEGLLDHHVVQEVYLPYRPAQLIS
jgi:hypothetical protein